MKPEMEQQTSVSVCNQAHVVCADLLFSIYLKAVPNMLFFSFHLGLGCQDAGGPAEGEM
jgi:hypothetical protein|uniref:Uncharacterized protein n=1 Tax=Zea mays TaxID=4577 RepID=B4FIS4_MAIZE|nr:unknown [Zea mays]